MWLESILHLNDGHLEMEIDSMERTEIEIELLTPMYLGGATKQPEFRIPSIKGLLRFWLRAIDPDYRKWEPKVFGDAGDYGASPFILRLASRYKKIRTCHIIDQPERSNTKKCIQRG
ncbi:MAG: type III-B CRISPR module RAMP protein Cmr1, partial [Candidatus Lokiarchaeota archaeon]|nr:type III-B CRISPR module RAMP protein Cmr1 [Candidatus Lokiarchaeota archaeon]